MLACRRWFASGMVALLLALAGCGGGDQPTTTHTTVNAAGAHVVGAGGIVLDIPAGALNGEVNLQVTNAGDGAEPAVPGGFRPVSGVYTITPHIEPFGAPVTISVPVLGAADGKVVYLALARPGEDWVLYPTTVSGGMASAASYHFSYVMVTSWDGYIQSQMGPFGACVMPNSGCVGPDMLRMFQLFSSVPLTAIDPAKDPAWYAFNQPMTLSFQGTAVWNNQSGCAGERFYLHVRNWTSQAGVWTLHTLVETSQDLVPLNPGATISIPIPALDAAMNGWLDVEAAHVCLVPSANGGLVPKAGYLTSTGKPSYWELARGPVKMPLIVPPVISQQPLAQSVAAGLPATFSVSATGAAPLAYQWLRNGVAISGATAASYTLASAQLADSGATFTVTVTDGNGNTTTSIGAVLTVTAAALQITLQPQAQSVAVGQLASFSVGATGTAALSYQWYRNGTAIAGATAAIYTLSNAQLIDSGATFTVTVTDGNGSTVTSGGATLTVTTPVVAACTGSNNTGWCRTFDDTTAASAGGFQGASATFTSLDFGSSAVGLAASQTSSPGLELLRTVDGGNTWTHVAQAPFAGTGSVGINFNEVAFADANTAVAIGSSAGLSKVYRSTDAGVSWVEVGSYTPPAWGAPRTPGLLQYIRFTDALTGVISAQGSFLRTTNSGASWALVTPNLSFNYNGGTATNTDIRSMARLPGTATLLAFVGDLDSGRTCLMRSTDGGLTWSVSTTLPASPTLDAVGAGHLSFANANVGVLLDNNSGGTIYRTTDGGLTWTQVSTFPAAQVLLKADGTGVAVSVSLSNGANIAYTADFGATWHTALSGTTNALAAVASPASGKFVAAGSNAIVVNNQGGTGP